MGHHLTTAGVARMASDTLVRASRLSRPSSVLGWWHERKFVSAVDAFTRALRAVPQHEVERASQDELREIGEKVDGIIAEVEVFIGRHGTSSLRRVERDRYLVKRIYELRASYEKLARGITAQPGMTDLRWDVKIDTAHRDQ